MKTLIFGAIMLVIGVAFGNIAANKLNQSRALPSGVMSILGFHLSELKKHASVKNCNIAAGEQHLRQLNAIAQDVVPIFTKVDFVDEDFVQLNEALESKISAALLEPVADCKTLFDHTNAIEAQCKQCHQTYQR